MDVVATVPKIVSLSAWAQELLDTVPPFSPQLAVGSDPDMHHL